MNYDELYQRVYAPIHERDPEAEYQAQCHAQWVEREKHFQEKRNQSRVDAIETRKRECKRQ